MDNYHHGSLQASLLIAARHHLQIHGLDSLSLRDLARQAGVSPTAVYHHFESKQALLTALVRQELEEMVAAWRGLDLPRLGPAYIAYFREKPAMASLIFHPDLRHDPTVAALQDQAFATIRDALSNHPQADAAALFLWALVHGIGQLFHSGFLGVDPALKPGYPDLWYQDPGQLLAALAPFIDRALAPDPRSPTVS